MLIVAKASVITQSEADDLLVRMDETIQSLLKGGNDTVVASIESLTNGVGKFTTLEDHSDKPLTNSEFEWTKEAEQVRSEIAILANVNQASIHADFSIFELGLDSLDVIKLSSRLKKQSVEIPVSVIIKCQTIAKMATQFSRFNYDKAKKVQGKTIQEMSQDLTTYLQARLPSDVETILPATPLQQSMVNEMIKSHYIRYFNMEAFVLGEEIDQSRLMTAVDSVILQSPILRTTFFEIEDPQLPVSYAQIVHKDGSQFAEYNAREGESIENLVDRLSAELITSKATDHRLYHIRYTLIGQTRYMIMAISHALYDGRSLRALHEDINKAYRGKLTPRPDPLPYLEEVFGSTTEEAKRFWKSTLSNLPLAIFPKKDILLSDRNKAHRLERRSRIPLKDIEAVCKSSRITLQTLGQTCWALVLSHLTGQLDVVFGSVLSCRDSEEADEVMFPLMNTVVVRAVLHGSLNEMLRYMQEMSDSTRQYQHFPLGTAQAFALASRDNQPSTDTTLFDTLFIYQGRQISKEADPLYNSVYGTSEVEFPICVEMEILDNNQLSWTTACKSIARDARETEELINALDTVLQRILHNPDAPAIISDADGISVCGLPKFKRLQARFKNGAKKASKPIDEEWSQTELNLRKALHEISNVSEEQIHKDSTIFHLGLDSILVLKLPALLKSYGIKIRVSDILKHLTISSIAQSLQDVKIHEIECLDVDSIIAEATSSLDVSSAVNQITEIGEVQDVLPATAGQLYAIRRWQESRGALFYPSFTYSLPGQLDTQKLDNAWKKLLERHDILRTGFVETKSGVAQVVFKSPPNEVLYESHSTTLRKNLGDLRQPLLNLVVEKYADSTKLILVIHHALYDGISIQILIHDLTALYEGETLPAPEHTFRDFVARTVSSSQSSAQQRWASYLANSLPLHISQPPSTNLQRTEVFHPSLKISSLKTQARFSGVTVDSLLLASVSKIRAQQLTSFASFSPNNIILGIYIANRAPFGEDLSNLAAPTLNLLPLKIEDPMVRSIEDIAKGIQRDLGIIGGEEMVGTSLEEILKWTGVRVDFFVNILRGGDDWSNASRFLRVEMDLEKRAKVVDGEINPNLEDITGKDAYLVCFSSFITYFSFVGSKLTSE